MLIGNVEWEKQGTVVRVGTPVCDCGSFMRLVGSAGCPHDSEYTYFLQCPTCKTLETTDHLPQCFSTTHQGMEEAGWKPVTKA